MKNIDIQSINKFDVKKQIYLTVVGKGKDAHLIASKKSCLGRFWIWFGWGKSSMKEVVKYLEKNHQAPLNDVLKKKLGEKVFKFAKKHTISQSLYEFFQINRSIVSSKVDEQPNCSKNENLFGYSHNKNEIASNGNKSIFEIKETEKPTVEELPNFSKYNDFFALSDNKIEIASNLKSKPFVYSAGRHMYEYCLHALDGKEIQKVFVSKKQFHRVLEEKSKNLSEVQRWILQKYYHREWYQVYLARSSLKNDPLGVLKRLCKNFSECIYHKLQVSYTEHTGSVDTGGQRRQFISELFKNFCIKMQFKQAENGFFLPRSKESERTYPYLNDNDKRSFMDLGQLIMFCMNADEEYPLGQIFDRGFYHAIINFPPYLLDNNFEEIDISAPGIFQPMFQLYKEMNSFNEDDVKKVERIKKYLLINNSSENEIVIEAYNAVITDDRIAALKIGQDIKKMRQHHAEITRAVKAAMIGELTVIFAPIHAIAAGMRNSYFQSNINFNEIQCLKADVLAKALQGTVSKEEMINRLDVSAIPQHIQKWILDWIYTADQKKLELFLFAMTGTPSLGPTGKLAVIDTDGFKYHSCVGKLDIVCKTINSKEELFSLLEGSLDCIRRDAFFDCH